MASWTEEIGRVGGVMALEDVTDAQAEAILSAPMHSDAHLFDHESLESPSGGG